jgi:hypothetical protein
MSAGLWMCHVGEICVSYLSSPRTVEYDSFFFVYEHVCNIQYIGYRFVIAHWMDHADKSLRFDGFSFDDRLYVVDMHVSLLFLTATSHSISNSFYLNIQFV